jgi:hypothetical protein
LKCLYVHERLLVVYEVDVEEGEFHFSDCSTMMRRLGIWSAQDPRLLISELRVDCLLHSLQKDSVEKLTVTDRSMMPW